MLLRQPELARADYLAARCLAEGAVDVAAPELTQALKRVRALIDVGRIGATAAAP